MTTATLHERYVTTYITGYPTTNAPPDPGKVPVFIRNCTFRILSSFLHCPAFCPDKRPIHMGYSLLLFLRFTDQIVRSTAIPIIHF